MTASALTHCLTQAPVTNRTTDSTASQSLDQFLAGVERRAFVIAEAATRNPEDALDLVQDAMLAFVRSYSQKPADQWAPLFHRVLQNRIRDWARRRKVRNRWSAWLPWNDEEPEADPIQQAADIAQPEITVQLDHIDASEHLMDAVRDLPLRQQQAFLLRVWEGLDVASTATAMGCSDGSVKTHLSRALSALRTRLQEYQP